MYKFGIEEMRGNCSVGQLTTVGYAQQVANGRALRKAYVESGFLSDHISPAEVYLRSDGGCDRRLAWGHVTDVCCS